MKEVPPDIVKNGQPVMVCSNFCAKMSVKRKSKPQIEPVRDRRISSIYSKTNSEYFPRSTSHAGDENDALRSARLLDSVVMYLNYREPSRKEQMSSKTTSSVHRLASAVTPTAGDMESVVETIITPQSFEQDLLSGMTVKERLLNEVDNFSVDKVRWFHCVTRSTFRSLLEAIELPFNAMNILLSSTPKSNIVRQDNGSIIIVLVSLTLDEEKNVNMDQVSIYVHENFILSFECLTSGNIIPENVNQLVRNTHFIPGKPQHEEKTGDEATFNNDESDQLSREFHLRTFLVEFSQTHYFFSEMRTKLKRKYTRTNNARGPPPSLSSSLLSSSLLPSSTPTRQRPSLTTRQSSSMLVSCPLDISYFIYESIQCMLHISIPVLNIYISHQKELANDLTFAPSHSTTHSIQNKEEIKVLRSGLNLISNLIERTFLCLQTNTSLLTSLLSLRPEYSIEIIDDYQIIFHLVQKLQINLEQLNDKIIHYEKKKTNQIQIALSMVSVLFFPIGFLASVFGQNFHQSGLINWMYQSAYGIYLFVSLNCFIFFLTIIIIYHKGWGDTLGELHVVGQIFRLQFNWWQTFFSSSNGIYLSKAEIDSMISSRKGTKSNRLAMHVNGRRYQRTGGGVGAGGGDRLRNFSV
jgi:Mg2+ and Co2+ transporter CorA